MLIKKPIVRKEKKFLNHKYFIERNGLFLAITVVTVRDTWVIIISLPNEHSSTFNWSHDGKERNGRYTLKPLNLNLNTSI